MGRKYCLGLDFGTKSGRALLVETATGREVATAVKPYTHDVMDEYLPDGKTRLEPDWALQHPGDYLEVIGDVIPAVLKESGVDPQDVVGLGIDFTACTMMPVDSAGKPLCFYDELKGNPHAYVKLWKHHAAQDEANRLNDVAYSRGERFLARYGGKVSSEWMFPKIWQILNEAPDIYYKADQFVEAADWVIMQLTGHLKRNSCTAGYKALWNKREGFPSKEFFKALDPRLENVIEEKFKGEIYPLGMKAGKLTEEAARITGLRPGTSVAVANLDAHAAVLAVGITEPGKMLIIIGTSACHMLLDTEEKIVPGMCGVVEDGIIPGLMGYEAGQSCCGDHFEWFMENCVPAAYAEEAGKRGISLHRLLEEKASALKAGESGLLALDWWNGNRSVLMDADLTGMLLGCTLLTKPEEIYRALIEATAFGTRMIIETFRENGVPVRELYAAGGIAEKNALMMQIYSDVTGMDIKIAGSSQAAALGAAMFGAVAAGKEKGGYDNIGEAAKAMAKVREDYYKPVPENTRVYDKLYAEYRKLYDYFGRGGNSVMKRLKEIRMEALK